MLTEKRLNSEIEELMNGKETVQTYEKLANLFVVKDHVYPEQRSGYSSDNAPTHVNVVQETERIVDDYGDSEFLQSIKGRDAGEMWLLMDEAMDALFAVNRRLYNSIMNRI